MAMLMAGGTILMIP